MIPVFKQGSRLECDNYRSVSVLPVLAKIVEKGIFTQYSIISSLKISLFLINMDLSQIAPPWIVSCRSCLRNFYNSWSRWLCRINFLGTKQASDTVNHSTLLSKLLFNGISDVIWFKSYLNKRKQRVSVSGLMSDTISISTGVPQGSNLGPLLFLIYINDFIQASNFLSMRLFVDDTSLTASDKNID